MRLLRWMIEHVAVVYPAGYREAHGDEIVDGLTEAAIENTRFGLARHIASVAVHGWITRARYATGGRRGEAVRQGLLLALVVTLGLATADASGWRGWPYVFATGLLLAGMWVLLSKAGWTMKAAAAAAVLVAGHEFYDPHQIVLPLVGAFSLGIVALALGLRVTGGTRHPGRTVAAVGALGIGATVLSGDLPTTYYLLPALIIVGLLAAIVDARAAVAAVVVPVLTAITQLDTTIRVGSDRFTWQLFAAVCIGLLAVWVHMKRDGRGRMHPS